MPNNLFEKSLSSSRLKTFLTCKRGYYLKYIQNIQDEDMPSDEIAANEIGNFLHVSLQELYEGGASFSDAKSLHVRLKEILFSKQHKDILWLLEREVWQRKLWDFCQNEINHFKQGWRPFAFELKLECQFEGVRMHGFVDRIDKNTKGEFCVLDYKSGKINQTRQKDIENMNDFQLQFYYLLAQERYKNVTQVGFYDLNSSCILWEDLMEEKLDKLSSIICELKEQKQINFALEEKDCAYSPYDILLGRFDG